jgi:hypothetical protein
LICDLSEKQRGDCGTFTRPDRYSQHGAAMSDRSLRLFRKQKTGNDKDER